MTIEWWELTNASDDSIWYEEENLVIWDRKEKGEFSRSENEGEDLWAQKEVSHLTRLGRHFKPFELEGEHPGREIEKGKGITMLEEEEEDRVPKQVKKTQANITIWVY